MSGKKERIQNFAYSRRVETGPCILAFEALWYLAAHTALVIATACFLWWAEARTFNLCIACNADYEWISAANSAYSKPSSASTSTAALYPLNILLFDYSSYNNSE
jgi:hypothetical protein